MDTPAHVLFLGESLYLLAIQAELERCGVETRQFASNTSQEGLSHFMEIWKPDFVVVDEECREATLQFVLWQPGINLLILGKDQDLTMVSSQKVSTGHSAHSLLHILAGAQPDEPRRS
jgi:hypothetical protein